MLCDSGNCPDNTAMKIALIGMPAIGKTSLGRKLARYYDLPFDDLDQLLVNELGCSIAEYFERMGEAQFRDAEARLLAHVAQQPGAGVLATGGGIVLRAENRAVLKSRYHVIYLAAQPEMLLRRLRHDQSRPLLQVADPLAKLQELHAQRHPLYEETAHFTIQADTAGMRAVLQGLYDHLDALHEDISGTAK